MIGISEVAVGLEVKTKFCNIEATEEAMQNILRESMKKRLIIPPVQQSTWFRTTDVSIVVIV